MPSADAFGNAATTLENNASFIKAVAAQPITSNDISTQNLWGDPAEPTPQ